MVSQVDPAELVENCTQTDAGPLERRLQNDNTNTKKKGHPSEQRPESDDSSAHDSANIWSRPLSIGIETTGAIETISGADP